MERCVYTHTDTTTYEARDTYLEKVVSGTSDNTSYKPTTTTSTYDPTGRRVAITENTPISGGDPITRLRYFSFDADGNIATRRDGTLDGSTFTETANSRQHFTYVNGQQLAAYGEDGHLDAASQLTAFDSSDMGAEPTLVLEGDTLQSIAQRVYGNPSLWYVLAAANAVSDADLVAGTTLKAPQVKTTANDASTFKPYDPNSITGPTTPSLPYISAPSQHGCNTLATVIRIFVAVVVTYVSMNPAAGAAVAGLGETAAQAVEIEDGDRQGYDWGQVGVSALTAGFAASEAGQSFGAWAAQYGRTGQFVRGAAMAAASDVASYALHKALGENTSFSLRGMVSDSLAAGISAGALGPAPTVNGVPAGTVSAGTFNWTLVAKAAVTSVVRQGINYGVHQAIEGHARWNNGQVLGNAITDAAVTAAGMAVDAKRAEASDLLKSWVTEDALQRQQMIAAEAQSDLPPWMLGQSGSIDASVGGRSLDDIQLAGAGQEAYYGQTAGRVSVSQNVNLENVLDLTDPAVQQQLNITIEKIAGDSYFYTHQLGDFARNNGYDGILAPSARNPGGSNLVIFPRKKP